MNQPFNSNDQPRLGMQEMIFTPAEILWKYLSWLPLFAGTLGATMIVATLWVRYQEPVYKVGTRVLVKTNKDNPIGGATNRSNSDDLIESSLFSTRQVNLENEIVLISALPLLEEVVRKHRFNDHYYVVGNIRKAEIWPAPFQVFLESDSLPETAFYLKALDRTGGMITFNGNSLTGKTVRFSWDKPLTEGDKTITLKLQQGADMAELAPQYYFSRTPVFKEARRILKDLKVNAFSPKTTIIRMELRTPNLEKGSAILDAMVEQYNQQNVGDKTTVLNHTISFINQRLDYITRELGDVESSLRDFKDANRLIDLPVQSEQVLSRQNALEDELVKLGVEEEIYGMVKREVEVMEPKSLRTIPELGSDPGSKESSGVVAAYNALLLRKKREEPLLGTNSVLLRDLNHQLEAALQAVREYLVEYGRSLKVRRQGLEERRRQFEGMVSRVPAKEKTLAEIKRQQNVKEGLYLYLLEKREESAIATAGTLSNYVQVEPAGGSTEPVEPNATMIYFIGLMFGFGVPVLFIFIRDLFDDNVRNREHITSVTKMPILAEISHVSKMGSDLVVADQSRSLIAEQFRVLRTNLNFLLQGNKVILVTSTVSGEGKSFVALNLAAVLALSGKKVALLELDLRKPRILRNSGMEKRNLGLSNYLSRQTDSIEALPETWPGHPTLDVFPCGPIPPNPAELMIGERMSQLFSHLRSNYDFVVVDTAPLGPVSDAFNLVSHSDMTVYLVRQRSTRRKQIHFLNELYASGRLHNSGIVINDVKIGARHGYYGYNYGYGYGYGTYSAYGSNNESYFDVKEEAGILTKITNRIRSFRSILSRKN